MKKVDNSFEEWQKLYLTCRDHPETELEMESGDVAKDIAGLRYFLPLAVWLNRHRRATVAHPMQLTIRTAGESKNERNALTGRLVRFFPDWKKRFPFVSINIDDEPLPSLEWEASRIFPLCALVMEKTARTPTYRCLRDRCYDPAARRNKETGENSFAKLANQLLAVVCDKEKLVGTKEAFQEVSAGEKERLAEELVRELDVRLPAMDILSQLVWLYILRELINSKFLLCLEKNAPALRTDVLEKSRLDAITYGEAVYQLIENACLHSDTRQAWFSFRMYRAGRGEPMGRLSEEVGTRQRLYKRYINCFKLSDERESADKDNIFNQDHRFYFEFFVLDHAADQVGMAAHHNRDLFELTREDIKPYYAANDFPQQDSYPSGKEEKERWEKAIQWLNENRDYDIHLSIRHMQDLFSLATRAKPLEAHIQDITVHYGLRLLRHIVRVNGGYLMGRTPGGKTKTQAYFDGNPLYNMKTEETPSFITEWSAILPITDRFPDGGQAGARIDGADILARDVATPPGALFFEDAETIFAGADSREKQDVIQILRRNLAPCFSGVTARELQDAVILLDIGVPRSDQLEWLAKALFSCISETHARLPGAPLRIAVVFPDSDSIHEFTRLCSIFYLRLSDQPDMEHTQLALCSRVGDMYGVSLILAGPRLRDVEETARLFCYHQVDGSLRHLPLISYLTAAEKGAEPRPRQDTGLFPFDLFLPRRFPEKAGRYPAFLDPWKSSWFTERMHRILHTDIREKPFGCLVGNVHIRLSARIHLDQFFEAELLFHDVGNIQRFAYLITQSLLYGDQQLRSEENVLLLGYDKYSASTILQVEHWLKKTGRFKGVYSSIIYDDEAEDAVKVRSYFDRDVLSESDSGVQAVTILPIGTTLATIYKIQNAARREIGEALTQHVREDTFSRNFCLVLVNEDLTTNLSNRSQPTRRYWDTPGTEHNVITVQRERAKDPIATVKYLIPAKARWYMPDDCALCKKTGADVAPLIDVRLADTMPAVILPLAGEHGGSFSKLVPDIKRNTERLNILFGSVHYSHIGKGNNHFQFLLDFRKIFIENREEIEESLRGVKVARDAFHVVVSPLQITNSAFAKTVIDCAFSGNARFLQFDIADAYREEVRAKFSYITEEYRIMKRANLASKFCVHFVDSSIIKGNYLNRARLLLQMLLQQSGLDFDEVRLFDKVFVLVNRSSYDSCNYFVREPEKNLHAFLYLPIPSYNTDSDSCPACRVGKGYELLAKRSSTEQLSKEFQRLEKKHEKRTATEHLEWQTDAIMNRPSYFSWLKEWLYVNVPEAGHADGLLCFTAAALQRHPFQKDDLTAARDVLYVLEQYFSHTNLPRSKDALWDADGKPRGDIREPQKARSAYLEAAASTALKDVVKYAREQPDGEDRMKNFQETALRLIRRHMIGVRDHMRLVAMYHSYEALSRLDEREPRAEAEEYRNVILELISDSILENMGQAPLTKLDAPAKKRFHLACAMEWIISYVKVISREQLANYYPYRQAIAGIITDMLRILRSPNRAAAEEQARRLAQEGKIKEEIVEPLCWLYGDPELEEDAQLCAMYRYQVYIILLHRSANLQIHSGIDGSGTLALFSSYWQIQEQYFSYRAARSEKDKGSIPYIEIPTWSELLLRYLKSVKTTVMPSNNAVTCLQLMQVPNELKKQLSGRSRDSEYTALMICANYLYLENTGVLYTGLRLLMNQLSEQYAGGGVSWHLDDYGAYIKNLGQTVEDILRRSYGSASKEEGKEEDIFYQNSLGNFCRFWHKSTGYAPFSATDGGTVRVTSMLYYFWMLDQLSSDDAKGDELAVMPYRYEALCRTLCGVTDVEMCYIAYDSEGNPPEIIAQSGYYMPLRQQGQILDQIKAAELIRRARYVWEHMCLSPDAEEGRKAFEDRMLIPGVAYLKSAKDDSNWDRGTEYLIMSFPRNDSVRGSERFYVFLQKKPRTPARPYDNEMERRLLRAARDVLFLRQRLQKALSRDYTTLINFRFDCSYVRPFGSGGAPHPSVLHITDIHMQGNPQKFIEKMKKRLEELRTDGEPAIDLLIITGDVIDSRKSNASVMEENYGHVKTLLDAMAYSLWAKDEYLPTDWNRRIVITTGNHDFASMNQYQAVLKRRALSSAAPIEDETGAIAKFGYFIDFLTRYLDLPADKLIRDALNSVRYYRKLDLKVLTLNCSSAASARRTNKIGIDSEIVRRLLRQGTWRKNEPTADYDPSGKRLLRYPFRICAAHYSPQYKLSYFLDNYDTLPGWDRSDPEHSRCCVNQLFGKFLSALLAEQEYRGFLLTSPEDAAKEKEAKKIGAIRAGFQTELGYLQTALDILEKGGRASNMDIDRYCARLHSVALLRKLTDEQMSGKVKENDLYQRFRLYVNWIERGCDISSEQISQLVFEAGECDAMSKYDQEEFQKFVWEELSPAPDAKTESTDAGDYKKIVCRRSADKPGQAPAVDLFLAGHIHAYGEDMEKRILIADRFLDQEAERFRGYVIRDIHTTQVPEEGEESIESRFMYRRLDGFGE